MDVRHLFVYGSLRRAVCAPALRPVMERACAYVGMAWVRGRLYQVADYPGLVVDGRAGPVVGELYLLRRPRQALAALDAYEGCAPAHPGPHEFRRRPQPVVLAASRRTVAAWLYQYNRPVEGLALLASGDYLRP